VGSGGALRSTEDGIYYTPGSRPGSTIKSGGDGTHPWMSGTSEVSGHVVEVVLWRSSHHVGQGLQRRS